MTIYKFTNYLLLGFLLMFCLQKQANAQLVNANKNFKIGSTIQILSECQNETTIRLRLFNNTKWAIMVPTFSFYLNPKQIKKIALINGGVVYAMPNNKQISSLFYFVERSSLVGGKRLFSSEANSGDSYNRSWIAPNDSIFFSIPINLLNHSSELYVKFNYEWEMTSQGLFTNQPEHRVVYTTPEDEKRPLSICKSIAVSDKRFEKTGSK